MLARLEFVAFLAITAALVGARLMTGRINLRGLLSDKRTSRLSPERVQLLVLTLAGVAALAASFNEMRETNVIGLPTELVTASLGGSQSIYLLGKFLRHRTRKS